MENLVVPLVMQSRASVGSSSDELAGLEVCSDWQITTSSTDGMSDYDSTPVTKFWTAALLGITVNMSISFLALGS